MNIRRVAWLAFQVPLVCPATTAHGTVAARQGVIMRLIADDGLVGVPWPTPSGCWISSDRRSWA